MIIGKVTLTQEQANEIKRIQDIAYAIDIHSFNKRPDKAIAGLSTADLARALLIGYEVEPEYKVGDWAEFSHNGDKWISEIKEVRGQLIKPEHEIHIYPKSYMSHNVRVLTPEEIKAEKERRVWAGIGREVGEFRKGDVRITRGTMSGFVRTNCEKNAKDEYENGELKGFYPAESFISFEEVESNA